MIKRKFKALIRTIKRWFRKKKWAAKERKEIRSWNEQFDLVKKYATIEAAASDGCEETLVTIFKNESTGDREIATLMEYCAESAELWVVVLSGLESDSEIAENHQTAILNWIILHGEETLLVDFVRKLELSEKDIERLYKKTGYLTESGNFDHGECTVYRMIKQMSMEEFKEFFEVTSKNELMREATVKNVKLFAKAICELCKNGDTTPVEYIEIFDTICELLPECVPAVATYILDRPKYTGECRLERHILWLIADSMYGYTLSKREDAIFLKEWVRNHTLEILMAALDRRWINEIVWLLKEKFDVESDEISYILEHYAEDYFKDVEENGVCCDAYELELADEYMLTSEGHYIMWANCYRLAQAFPGSVTSIRKCFANVDAGLMLVCAEIGAGEWDDYEV